MKYPISIIVNAEIDEKDDSEILNDIWNRLEGIIKKSFPKIHKPRIENIIELEN